MKFMPHAIAPLFGQLTPAFLAEPRVAAPKYKLAACPTNKRGHFNKPGRGSQALRLVHPPIRPNCRVEHADRVVLGNVASIYPGNRADWR